MKQAQNKKKLNADSKSIFEASFFTLREGSEELLNVKRIFRMIVCEKLWPSQSS